MAKIRSRRMRKEDVLLPENLIELIEAMDSELAKAFILDVLKAGRSGNLAGFLVDDSELINDKVAESYDNSFAEMKSKYPAALVWGIQQLFAQMENYTTNYYQTALQNRNKRLGTKEGLTDEQKQEFENVVTFIKSHGMPNLTQSQIDELKGFIQRGGNTKVISIAMVHENLKAENALDWCIKYNR